MSKATKRKHVTKEVMDEFALPEGSRTVVKVVSSRGNNLHEVASPKGESFLVSMPTKFRKNVWIKRGDFLLVEPIEEGVKVKAEITHILYKEQIKYIKDQNLWPSEFDLHTKNAGSENNMIPDDMLPPSDDELSFDEDDDEACVPIVSNPNRRIHFVSHDSDISDDEIDDSASDDEDE